MDALNTFLFPAPLKALHEICFNWLSAFKDMFKIVSTQEVLVKRQLMTLMFCTHRSSLSHSGNCIYHFRPQSSKLSIKSYVQAFSHS